MLLRPKAASAREISGLRLVQSALNRRTLCFLARRATSCPDYTDFSLTKQVMHHLAVKLSKTFSPFSSAASTFSGR